MRDFHDLRVKEPRSPAWCVLAARIARELCGSVTLKRRGRREDRAPAGTHGPRAAKKARGRTTGSAEIVRPSLRNGFNGLLRALPGDRALLPPSPARCGRIFADLAPASGRQDHTAWPSATTSFVRALRLSIIFLQVHPATSAGRAFPDDARAMRCNRVHRIPPPRS